MSEYKFFIYKIESHADAVGEYIGPFATEQERDDVAQRMRCGNKNEHRLRTQCVYRANVEEDLAATFGSPAIVAA